MFLLRVSLLVYLELVSNTYRCIFETGSYDRAPMPSTRLACWAHLCKFLIGITYPRRHEDRLSVFKSTLVSQAHGKRMETLLRPLLK